MSGINGKMSQSTKAVIYCKIFIRKDILMKIKQLRKINKMSQEELAQKVEVTGQTISNWETGKSLPDIEQTIKLALAFNMKLDEFIKTEMETCS